MTSGQHVVDRFEYVTCTRCEWSGGTDVLVDLEPYRSMRTQYFVCPMCGHDNETDTPWDD